MARYTTSSDISLLKRYAATSQVGIVEIGCLDGETTVEMASVSYCPIYSIDPIIFDSMGKNLIGHEELIYRNMQNYQDRFLFIKDYSFNVAKTFYYPFDFLFIDGDHSYSAVKRDFEEWSEKLEPSGFIAFHDSAPNPEGFQGWEGPIKLVAELKNQSNLLHIEHLNGINVFQKLYDN